jgi:hypothetical protein
VSYSSSKTYTAMLPVLNFTGAQPLAGVYTFDSLGADVIGHIEPDPLSITGPYIKWIVNKGHVLDASSSLREGDITLTVTSAAVCNGGFNIHGRLSATLIPCTCPGTGSDWCNCDPAATVGHPALQLEMVF